MGKFTGYLLCSDIDGTFSVNTKPLKENIEAAMYFTKNGGRFTVATGRTAAYFKELEIFKCINAPVCTCNGSVVYDYQKEKVLRIKHENFTLNEFLLYIDDFKDKLEGLYVYYTPKTKQAPNMARGVFKEEELNSKPIKIVCTFDDVKKAEIFKKFCLGLSVFKNTYISNSWDTGVEFNPIEATKGEALKFIKNTLTDVHTSIAIGDYENDIPMLKEADISVSVGDATDDVKKICDIIVKNASEAAVADLINIIERKL